MNDADEFEWDEAKRTRNIRKHGVDFTDAIGFDWSHCLTREDDDAEDEYRFTSIGLIYGIVHVLTWADRDGRCRVISLRKADRPEIRRYEG